MDLQEERLGRQFALCCDEARAKLRKHMARLGLREQDGWRIYEFTRQADGCTEMVMRPLHRELVAPAELECVCVIDEPGANVASECRD